VGGPLPGGGAVVGQRLGGVHPVFGLWSLLQNPRAEGPGGGSRVGSCASDGVRKVHASIEVLQPAVAL
jgi:hypothetical protein